MTNAQIIETECILNGVTEPVDTYQGWTRVGKQVKKGSKALFQTRIWKPRKNTKTRFTESENNTKTRLTEEEMESRFILVKASFFGLSQVE